MERRGFFAGLLGGIAGLFGYYGVNKVEANNKKFDLKPLPLAKIEEIKFPKTELRWFGYPFSRLQYRNSPDEEWQNVDYQGIEHERKDMVVYNESASINSSLFINYQRDIIT